MKGNMEKQVRFVMREYISQIGSSKHADMQNARAELVEKGESPSSSAIAAQTGIYSFGTLDKYTDKLNELANFAKETDGVRDLVNLSAETVQAFLAEKIEVGVSLSHFSGYCAAIQKLETGLSAHAEKFGYDRQYNFSERNNDEIKTLRDEARQNLTSDREQRAYEDPKALIDSLERSDFRLVASLQYESGMRINEASNLKESQFKGFSQDKYTGEKIGLIDFQGKGGRHNTAQVSPETYEKVLSAVKENGGNLSVNQNDYRSALEKSSHVSNQNYTGSHGLRWSYAQERYQELREHKLTDLEARQVVSHELGHNRLEITNLYLGKS